MFKEVKHRIDIKDFQLEVKEELLYRGGEHIPLAPKAIKVLLVLVQNPGRLVTKEELLKTVWPDTFVEEGNLNVHIHSLRKVFNEGGAEERFIETVPRRGFRFIAPVKEGKEGEQLTAPSEPLPLPSAKTQRPRLIWAPCILAVAV